MGAEIVANAANKSMNEALGAAKAAKKDEFYTQYVDIQKEVEAYLEFDPDTFRDKVIYCNCDDPFESNFFKYFAANFNRLGLKKLISTSYDGSPIAGEQLRFEGEGTANGAEAGVRTDNTDVVRIGAARGAARIDDDDDSYRSMPPLVCRYTGNVISSDDGADNESELEFVD